MDDPWVRWGAASSAGAPTGRWRRRWRRRWRWRAAARRRRAAVGAGVLLALAGCASGDAPPVDDPLAPVPTTQPAAVPGSGFRPPVVVGTIDDPDINESSGLAASRTTPGAYWTHNDSGDGAFLYCLDSGAGTCGVWRVTGADAVDWEDMAAGPGPVADTSYLYVGDIGDNDLVRREIVVYRLPEPVVSRAGLPPPRASPAGTEPVETLRLRYPDGPHDAEALLVHPASGDVYVVAKEPRPGVYVARAPLADGSTTTLERLATLPIGAEGDRITQVTGGDISPDGLHVALSTYGQGFELRVPLAAGTSFDEVWEQQPRAVTLGLRAQGEAIAYRLDGHALLATSEHQPGFPVPLLLIEES